MALKELNIRLDGLDLKDDAIASLEREVNELVLRHIAKTKQSSVVGSITGNGGNINSYLPPGWRGLVIRKFATEKDLKLQPGFIQVKTVV